MIDGYGESPTNEKISNLTDTINFVYDSPINGFNISVTLMNLSDYIDDKIGTAEIYLEKDGMIHTIYHPSFILDASSFSGVYDKKDKKISYKISPSKYFTNKELGQFQDVPFCFFDVDLDGEKELLLRHPTIGQHACNGYSAYKIPQTQDGDFEAVPAISNLQKKMDFPILDDFTEIDTVNQCLILKCYKGNDDWSREKYFYRDGNLIIEE